MASGPAPPIISGQIRGRFPPVTDHSQVTAAHLLGWATETSGWNSQNGAFEHGLKKTIHWFSKKENLKFYKTNIFND